MSFRLTANRSQWAGFFMFIFCSFSYSISNGMAAELEMGKINDYQARFEEGVKFSLAGNYLSAATVFEQLYSDTQSQRVKLEWARALYYLGNYERAEVLFNEVLAANPPLPVRKNVNTFLEEMAISTGKFDYLLGIVRDTNPRAIPTDRTFNILGTPLTYTPQFDTSPQYGLSYKFMASKSLDDKNNTIGSISMYGIKFGSTYFDSNSFEAALSHKFSELPRVQTRLAIERKYYAGEYLYDYPSVGISHALEGMSGSYWNNGIKIGAFTYPVYSYLNGTLSSYTTLLGKNVLPQAGVGVEFYFDRLNADESAYAYKTSTISLIGKYQFNTGIFSQIRISTSSVKYDSADHFFGITRSDNKRNILFTFVSENFDLIGLTPIVEFGYEESDSNISFYSFNKMMANISFKKSY